MKNRKMLRVTISLVLAVVLLCSFNTVAFATQEYSGVHTFTMNGESYSATVVRTETYSSREIPIMSSVVTVLKNGSHTFGGCSYNVNYTNQLWTSYVSQLDTAGAKIGVYSTYNRSVQFVNTVTVTSPGTSHTYCAVTTLYGYTGNCYVQRHTSTPQIVHNKPYSFAPFNCSNMILYVIDTQLL